MLDPFAGTGTTVSVADCLERVGLGIEANLGAEGDLVARFVDVSRRLAVVPIRPRKTSTTADSGPLFAASTPRKAGPL